MRLEGTGCGVWEAEQDGMGVCINYRGVAQPVQTWGVCGYTWLRLYRKLI